MKSLLKSLYAILFTVISMFIMPAFAANEPQPTVTDQLNTELARMNDAQKATVLKNIQNPSVVSTAERWAGVGEGIGKGIAATARELGVAVNEFANSPVGIIAILLLVWNYAGDSILSIVFVLGFATVALPIWLRSTRNWFGQYNADGKFVRYDWQQYVDNGTTEFGGMLVFLHSVSLFAILLTCIVKWP